MNKLLVVSIMLLTLVLICQPYMALGQSDTSSSRVIPKKESAEIKSETLKTPEVINKGDTARVSFMSDREFFLGIVILVFGIIVIFIEYLIIKNVQNLKTENAIKFIGVTLIILGGLFLITSGFSGEEIAPIVGLLGTVAGYLLGKSD